MRSLVVGAGITGTAVDRLLQRLGERGTVYEAPSDRFSRPVSERLLTMRGGGRGENPGGPEPVKRKPGLVPPPGPHPGRGGGRYPTVK